MCACVEIVDDAPEAAVWDPDQLMILVPRTADPQDAMREIRAILSDLDAPPAAIGALCYCGAPIPLPTRLLGDRPDTD